MSVYEKNNFDSSNYDHLAVLMQDTNLHDEWQNFSEYGSFNDDDDYYQQNDGFNSLPGIKSILYAIYILIFFVGICGNGLVCYVVLRNKSMLNTTNLFITNLAISDILRCIFALPFTPLYLFMNKWIFGRVLCHFVPYIQGTSVYVTTFTLVSIAIDRYVVKIYPFKRRLPLTFCYLIILAVWVLAGLLTLPYGILMDLVSTENAFYCDEVWPHETSRKVFMVLTLILQFVIPFIIIIFCYLELCVDIKNHVESIPEAEFEEKEMECHITSQTNRMLITMLIIFNTLWLPFNIYNFILDFLPIGYWKYLSVIFVFSHAAAMSSSCCNPFVYAWLNEKFRREFMNALPCFKSDSQSTSKMSKQEINK